MTKRRGDQSPEPRGGRAAERLRQFLEARMPPAESKEAEEESEKEAQAEAGQEPEQEAAPGDDKDGESAG